MRSRLTWPLRVMPAALERFGKNRAGVHRGIVNGDGDRDIVGGAGGAAEDQIVGAGLAGEPDGVFAAARRNCF